MDRFCGTPCIVFYFQIEYIYNVIFVTIYIGLCVYHTIPDEGGGGVIILLLYFHYIIYFRFIIIPHYILYFHYIIIVTLYDHMVL